MYSWVVWKIWKRRSRTSVKHSVSVLLATQVVPCPLNNLGNAVFRRYEHSGMEDLKEATTYYHEALSLHPPGHPNRPASLNNLASALLTRYKQSGKMKDLEEAITYNREALSRCPPGHTDRSTSLRNLGDAVFNHFRQLSKMEDLEEATTYYHEALSLHPPGHSVAALQATQIVPFPSSTLAMRFLVTVDSWVKRRIWKRRLHINIITRKANQ